MKKIISVIQILALVLLAGCAGEDTRPESTPTPEPAPAQTASPAPEPVPMLTGDAAGIERVTLTVGGSAYALNEREIAEVTGLLTGGETLLVAEPGPDEAQTGGRRYKLAFFYADGGADTVYSTEDGGSFYRFTGTEGPDGDLGYVLAQNEALGGKLADIHAYILAPELSADEIAGGDVLGFGYSAAVEVMYIEETARLAAQLINSGQLIPYDEAAFRRRQDELGMSPYATVTLYNAAGEAVVVITQDALGTCIAYGARSYLVNDEEQRAAADRLLEIAPHSAYFDSDDVSEYELSNGLRRGQGYAEVVALAGYPDGVGCRIYNVSGLTMARYTLVYEDMVLFMGAGVREGGEAPEPVESSTLLCIQLMGAGVQTARGISVGAGRDEAFEAYGIPIRSVDEVHIPYYPGKYYGGSGAYDEHFSFETGGDEHWASGTENHMQFLFTDGILTSIVLRTPMGIDAHPPLYPPFAVTRWPVYPNELFGGRTEGVAAVEEEFRAGPDEDTAERYHSSYSELQISQLSEVLANASITIEDAPPDTSGDIRHYSLTVSFDDGTSVELLSAEDGKILYTPADGAYLVASSVEIRDFLSSRTAWSDFELGLW